MPDTTQLGDSTMDQLVVVTLIMGVICIALASFLAGMMTEQRLTDPTK